MKTIRAIVVSFIITFSCLSAALSFDHRGFVTPEIDYEDIKFYPPRVNCDEPVVKGDYHDTECLPKVSFTLTYAFTEDREFKASLLFYNIFNEIIGQADIEETLRWEDDHVDVVDFIYMDSEFDIPDVERSHHIEWKIHEQKKDEPEKTDVETK